MAGGQRQVVIVDRAEAVADLEPFEEDGDDLVSSGVLRRDLSGSVARWAGAPQPVLLVEVERLAAR